MVQVAATARHRHRSIRRSCLWWLGRKNSVRSVALLVAIAVFALVCCCWDADDSAVVWRSTLPPLLQAPDEVFYSKTQPKIWPSLKEHIDRLALHYSSDDNLPNDSRWSDGGGPCLPVRRALEMFEDSDVLELRHCRFPSMDEKKRKATDETVALVDLLPFPWSDFCNWSLPILQTMATTWDEGVVVPRVAVNNSGSSHETDGGDWEYHPEQVLELLEGFATKRGYCDFTDYPLDIPDDAVIYPSSASPVEGRSPLPRSIFHQDERVHNDDEARLIMIIVAFKDADHLKRLIDALWRPQHLLIIHLERLTPQEYKDEVLRNLQAHSYNNILVLQFGSILYETDSVSMTNFRIFRWLVSLPEVRQKAKYDYVFTMGGAVYPLYSSIELARHMKSQQQQNRHVWMGELRHGGKSVSGIPQDDFLHRFRTQTTYPEKFIFKTWRDPRKVTNFGYDPTALFPPSYNFSKSMMAYKTNSGNQAVYSFQLIQKLVSSNDVVKLFALSKYGCCCCLEERTWIAALALLDFENDNHTSEESYVTEALRHSGMFQLWGGIRTCKGSMNNALLSMTNNSCFRLEDGSVALTTEKGVWEVPFVYGRDGRSTVAINIRGNYMPDMLREAKEKHGFLMARKFKSGHVHSEEVIQFIEGELWR